MTDHADHADHADTMPVEIQLSVCAARRFNVRALWHALPKTHRRNKSIDHALTGVRMALNDAYYVADNSAPLTRLNDVLAAMMPDKRARTDVRVYASGGAGETPVEIQPAVRESVAVRLCKAAGPGQDRFDVKQLFLALPEHKRRNQGPSAIYTATACVAKALGADYRPSDRSAPLSCLDHVLATLMSKRSTRADAVVDTSCVTDAEPALRADSDDGIRGDSEAVEGVDEQSLASPSQTPQRVPNEVRVQDTGAGPRVQDTIEGHEVAGAIEAAELGQANVALTPQRVLDNVRRVPDGHALAGFCSVIDVVMLVTGKSQDYSGKVLRKMDFRPRSPEFIQTFAEFQFKGRGQHPTPVAPVRDLIRVIFALPGQNARAFLVQCADILVRVFAGDENLHAEIDAFRKGMCADDRRDMLRGVEGAAPVEVEGENLITGVPFRASQSIDPSDASQIVQVHGRRFLREPDVQASAVVPPGFQHRQCFYIAYHTFDVDLRQPIWSYGWTADAGTRFPQHITQYGFPTSRPAVVMSTGDCHAKAVEDCAKKMFKPFHLRVGKCTESFACDAAQMCAIAHDVFNWSRTIVNDTWVDSSIREMAPPNVLDTPPFAKCDPPGIALALAQQETRRIEIREVEATKREVEVTKREVEVTRRARIQAVTTLAAGGMDTTAIIALLGTP